MFTIYRRNESGALIEVATVNTREAAENLMTRMQSLFPANQYEFREDSAGGGPPSA